MSNRTCNNRSIFICVFERSVFHGSIIVLLTYAVTKHTAFSILSLSFLLVNVSVYWFVVAPSQELLMVCFLTDDKARFKFKIARG